MDAVFNRVPVTPVIASDVEVELVVVELVPVKFWRVDDPRESKLPNVPRPELLCVVENKVVAKSEVVVALVEVEFRAVKFWRVVDELICN